MSDQTIQSQDIKIADVFQAFYVVPDYQREYVWQSEQVEQLLTDINTELQGFEPSKAPEYFIGSIVVCPGAEGVPDLIDGHLTAPRFDRLVLEAESLLFVYVVIFAFWQHVKQYYRAPDGTPTTGTDAYK